MSSINKVQQMMLSQMDQARNLIHESPIKPAAAFGVSGDSGISGAFEAAMRSVDARQHIATQATAAVDSGVSDNLAGAMIESQKASVSFSALIQVRNKLVAAFDDVMRMPL
jgi:flagellar hook-basal body complex protein FliE